VTMCMASRPLTVFLTTTHLSLSQAIQRLDPALIRRTVRHATAFLGTPHPRLVLAALNPHAGENGLLGREEIDHLLPLTQTLREEMGLETLDLLPADTAFWHARSGTYQGVICLYHDQGLIPFKLLAFETGVNVTLGLPFVRTSPDHGTAFNIAGQGIAHPRSFLEAARLAVRQCRLRQKSLHPQKRNRQPTGG